MSPYSWMGGYIIVKRPGSNFPEIVGRVYGQEEYAHYQIAARPRDEIAVGPFSDRQSAFNACVVELEIRRARG